MSSPNTSTFLRSVNPSIAVTSHDHTGAPAPPPSAEGREGLVSYQQSSHRGLTAAEAAAHTRKRGRVVLSAEQLARANERKAERRERLRRLAREPKAPPIYARAKHYRAVVESDDETITIDSVEARIRRCQRRVHAWAEALPHDNRAGRRYRSAKKIGPRAVMMTLTYEKADAWQPLQIRDFMKSIKRDLADNLLGYAWVLEMQQRGAPHYHVLLYVKRGTKIARPDDGLWEYGSSRIETAHSLYYICKYTGKMYQKEHLPIGARMFAVNVNEVAAEGADVLLFRLSSVPKWLREHLEGVSLAEGERLRWSRCPGGGWVVRNTGELLASPWRVRSIVEVD